jgi:hypothetical protein
MAENSCGGQINSRLPGKENFDHHLKPAPFILCDFMNFVRRLFLVNDGRANPF